MLLNVNKKFLSSLLLKFFFLAPEFGSTASAWKAIMAEADASAEIHQSVHDELQNDVVPSIKSWQKTKYIKSLMQIKTTKDFEEEFRRVRIVILFNQFLIIFEF